MRFVNENGTLNAYNVRGNEIKVNDRYGYKIIAVIHDEYFWAAYMGLTDWSDDRVAREGDKVSYEIAALLFPTINAIIPNYNS